MPIKKVEIHFTDHQPLRGVHRDLTTKKHSMSQLLKQIFKKVHQKAPGKEYISFFEG